MLSALWKRIRGIPKDPAKPKFAKPKFKIGEIVYLENNVGDILIDCKIAAIRAKSTKDGIVFWYELSERFEVSEPFIYSAEEAREQVFSLVESSFIPIMNAYMVALQESASPTREIREINLNGKPAPFSIGQMVFTREKGNRFYLPGFVTGAKTLGESYIYEIDGNYSRSDGGVKSAFSAKEYNLRELAKVESKVLDDIESAIKHNNALKTLISRREKKEIKR